MKAFRGSLVAALLLLVVGVAFWLLRPPVEDRTPDEGVRIFDFEKHELVKVHVERPGAEPITLEERDGRWIIAGTDFVAGRSMVNRVKHQLHDLTSRATVVEDPENPELYGLGANAIKVELTLRDGRTLAFEAGDPNPSSVSYYIRPIPGDTVYTVKKSAVDYYSLTLDEFRERRFAGFDSKDVTRMDATIDLPATDERPAVRRHLVVERTGDHEWQMLEPVQMAANDDRMRRLLGRVNALKARDFIEVDDAELQARLPEWGLDHPRLDITLSFASREPLRLRVGADAPSDNKYEQLAYVLVEGDDTIYIARRGLLDDFGADLEELRNRRVVQMREEDVVAVDATLRAEPGEDLEGEAGVRYAAEQWVWRDGVPVPGSTPKRVARYLAELEVQAFVDDHPGDLSQYGLDDPVARVVLRNAAGEERVVLIGAPAEPLVDAEGRERLRRYVAIEGSPSVYVADNRVFSVVQDLIREGNRKKARDLEKAARRERIPSEALPEDEPPSGSAGDP
ncbi:MAG: DUF4340 domain-containing protein [Deltaproteobacteria bacterium]|nr:MAG: DUF4340 domain-containing protein [Deltaproteobacteria bacterium]